MQSSNSIGWWEQNGLGRQAMHNLCVEFVSGQMRGTGTDIVGNFTLHGSLESGGRVQIVKQYIGRHHVIYLGQYDGEGTFFGTWVIDAGHGNWSIKILCSRSNSATEIQEIQPLPKPSQN
jgi:hypothetical protein